MSSFDLTGSSAVVTGGTKGIGRAVVKTFVQHGARVCFQGRDQDSADSLIAECSGFDGEAVFVRGDVNAFNDVKALMDESARRFGRVDVYVSSGGPSSPSPQLFTDMPTPAESFAMIQSRLLPRLNALHAAVPRMREQGYGKIVLLTTDAARMPTPSESMVGAAGASIIFLTRSLAKELASYGIRINAVATTITSGTPPYERYLAAKEAKSGEVLVKAFTKAHERASFRINTPQDIADYVLYLASPASDQVSGSTMSINGGLSFPSY